MKLNSGQLMGIFIVVIMLGSTAGFALWSSGNDDSGTAGQNPPPIENPTVLDFTAAGIEGKVVQIMPTIILFANTVEPQIDKIDAEIYAIRGVKQLQSYYRPNSDTTLGAGLRYFATIVYDAKITDIETIVSAVDGNSAYLTGASAGQYALVSVPRVIKFTNEKLGITKDYNSDGLLQILAEMPTLKDDLLEVSINSQFAGSQLVKIDAYETRNITAEPQAAFFSAEFQIAELQKSMSAYGTWKYGHAVDVNALQADVENVDGVTALAAQPSGTARRIKLNFDANISPQISDLNSKLIAISGIENTEYDDASSQIAVDFAENADYPEMLDEINSAILGSGIDQNIFQLIEPEKRIMFDLNLSDAYAGKIRDDVNAIFTSYGVNGDFSQKATIDANSVTSDKNETFSLPEGKFEANLVPGHALGDRANLSLYVAASRGIVEQVFASEVPEN